MSAAKMPNDTIENSCIFIITSTAVYMPLSMACDTKFLAISGSIE